MDGNKLTREEEIEFSKLKHIKCERGFFLPEEEKRWNHLFDKLARRLMPALKKSMLVDSIDFDVLSN